MKAESGDIRTDDVSLKDNAVLEVNATDGNVTVKKADVSSSDSSHASLIVTTRDKNQKKGNLTIGETLNAQGKVVLDLSGSLLGEIQKDGKEKTSTLILGNDVYNNGSSFSFGGDIGSREIPLVIDVTESNVPFKIVTVRNAFIRGAEHYRLTEAVYFHSRFVLFNYMFIVLAECCGIKSRFAYQRLLLCDIKWETD